MLLLFYYYFGRFLFERLDSGEGREKEGKHQRVVAFRTPPTGDLPTVQVCALTGNRTGDSVVCRPALSPLSHTPGRAMFSLSLSPSLSLFPATPASLSFPLLLSLSLSVSLSLSLPVLQVPHSAHGWLGLGPPGELFQHRGLHQSWARSKGSRRLGGGRNAECFRRGREPLPAPVGPSTAPFALRLLGRHPGWWQHVTTCPHCPGAGPRCPGGAGLGWAWSWGSRGLADRTLQTASRAVFDTEQPAQGDAR